MFRFFALAIACTIAAPAFAEEIVFDPGATPGTFYLKVVVAQDGSATVSPLKVVRLGSPSPTDPNQPNPGAPTAFQKEIQRQTQAALDSGASKNTGARVSAVYSLVSKSVADSSIPKEKALEAIKLGTDMALQGQPDAGKWAPWRASVGEALGVLQQDGSLSTAAQYATALKEVERGMNAATGFPGAAIGLAQTDPKAAEGILGGNFDLAKLIELIKMLLELFKLFKPI